MWAKFVLILCQHFILSLATNSSTPHGTAQTGFTTTFTSENSSTNFSSHTPLTTTLQNIAATDVETYPSPPSFAPTILTNTSHATSTVLSSASLNTTSQHLSPHLNATTMLSTSAPNITLNSSVVVTSYSLNVTNSSSQTDNATSVNSTTYSPMTNSTSHTTSLYTIDTNNSFTSVEPTSIPNSTQHKEFTTVKVFTTTFTTPEAFTTILSSSNPTYLPNTSTTMNNTEHQDRIASPSKAGTALTVIACLLVVIAIIGLVIYLKKRRVFYSRLEEDYTTGSWSNYNNPVFEDL
ncbi:prostate androgen-regulated mucin-like protein 1 homolog [Hemiscyllium ocellatum]|uniref:prostate androgen-regulated mucin-like protein 1 homolog n=1 Tax=Hemiscyllium ocellatum TaxID=170820 RepID=UPI002966B448|nr:prostate androgen-regulated mucin-like protein 1 homolog [Hemiscyllium ocellatum]